MTLLLTSLPSSTTITTTITTTTDQIPLSGSNNTVTQSNPQTTQQVAAPDNAMDVLQRKPDLLDNFEDSDGLGYIEKYNKYEADYVRRLKAKYFSKKNLYGGDIFEKEITIENETIKSSRWPCTRSFTDPVQSFEDQSSSSVSAAETSTNLPNRNY